uniref:Uncharacterized protein n=1 Tax=Rhizophora mucronata TaxID=61149 RepID=A0A2P2M9T0_RHIMU
MLRLQEDSRPVIPYFNSKQMDNQQIKVTNRGSNGIQTSETTQHNKKPKRYQVPGNQNIHLAFHQQPALPSDLQLQVFLLQL